MKNILFVVFLFLPFLSYSQVFSHSFEDSVLTVFVKPIALQSETDTIYPSGVPKKINFVFEDVDSVEKPFEVTIAILDKIMRPLRFTKYSTNGTVSYLTSNVKWGKENLMVFTKFKQDSILGSFEYIIDIIPKPILDELNRIEKQRIQDSLNRIAAIEYHKNHFEKLKEPQENLTKKDKKKIAKIYSKVIPPNGVKIDSLIFFDETEIANIHWLEYIHYLYKDSSIICYDESLPDTTVWGYISDSVYLDPYIDHYLRYPGFRYYPIVGISYQQAQEYCIWRANMINDGWKKQNKNKDYEVIVHYRLPTKEEWKYAAIKDDLNKQFGGYSTKRRYTEKEKRKVYRSAKDFSDSTYSVEKVKLDMKNYFESDTSYKRMFNYRVGYKKPYFDGGIISSWEGYAGSGNWITSWIYLYKPTRQFKLYNMFGNVAEMTSEKGIAKGGSFVHSLEESTADKVQEYDSPKAWLGFRCVAEVVVRKKEGK